MKKIILLLFVVLLCGCDYNDLDNLGVGSTLIIDFQDNMYDINLELVDTSNESVETYYIEGKGKSIETAINDLYNSSYVEPYFSHLSTCLITQSVASKHLNDMIDFFTRNTKFRKDFYFFLVNDINKLKEYKSNNGMTFGDTIKKMYENSMKKSSKYRTSQFRDILSDYLENRTFVMGSINIENENIRFDDMYLFDNNKLSMKLDSKAVLLKNILDNQAGIFTFESNYTYEIYKYKVVTDVSVDSINISFDLSVRLLNMKDEPINKYSDLKKLEKSLNGDFIKYIEDSIKYSFNIDKDLYNFNHAYNLHHNLKDAHKKVSYKIKVKCSILEKGLEFASTGTKN